MNSLATETSQMPNYLKIGWNKVVKFGPAGVPSSSYATNATLADVPPPPKSTMYTSMWLLNKTDLQRPRLHTKFGRWRIGKIDKRLDGCALGFRYGKPKEDDVAQSITVDTAKKDFENSGQVSYRTSRKFGQQPHGSKAQTTGRKLKELRRSSAPVKGGQKASGKTSNKGSDKKSKNTKQAHKSSGKNK